MTYDPDAWELIKFTKDSETLFKVLGVWKGGYLSGDSWRLNSGVVSIEEDEDFIKFHGSSGSTYLCYKAAKGGSLGITGYSVLNQLIDVGAEVATLDELRNHLEDV